MSDLLPLSADLLAVTLEGGELILEYDLRIPEEAADQGALAVVDAAAGDEAQHRLLFLTLEISENIFGDQIGLVSHQKYPSCFFFSIEPAESWSISRPCRSEVRVRSIS